jgi:hypothetical protein
VNLNDDRDSLYVSVEAMGMRPGMYGLRLLGHGTASRSTRDPGLGAVLAADNHLLDNEALWKAAARGYDDTGRSFDEGRWFTHSSSEGHISARTEELTFIRLTSTFEAVTCTGSKDT